MAFRWLRLVPGVVLPPPVGGLPDPVPVPVANQRCTLSIGAWERCCGFPIDWETELRLHLPAVAFELHDLHDRVCPWDHGFLTRRPLPLLVLAVQSLDPAAFHQAGSSALYSRFLKSMHGMWCSPCSLTRLVREVLSKHHKLVYRGAQKSLRQLL
jgi:hypothetical protein